MKVLVTGSTGFFGRAIVKRLKEGGHEVVGAARRPQGGAEYLDVSSRESCFSLIKRAGSIDAVVHAAAIAHANRAYVSEERCRLVNAGGARNMLEASISAAVKRFIFISTVKVYGEYDIPEYVTESHPASPQDFYAGVKRDAEGLCLMEREKTELYIFRMATMYGRGWFFNIRKRVALPLLGRLFYATYAKEQKRYSLCSDGNGAEAVLWAVEGKMTPGIYNVADHYDYCQDDILRAVSYSEGIKPSLRMPPPLPAIFIRLARRILPASAGERLYSRYWKFFGRNLYSSEKLFRAGVHAPPLLLELGRKTARND